MKCKNLRIRSKKYQRYIYCKKHNREILFGECRNCIFKEYKEVKEIKKKSSKLKKLEDERTSILTDNLNICYVCKKNKKRDLHEIFGGSNRRKSMIWALVIPICRECHKQWKEDKLIREAVQREAQTIFEIRYGHNLFMQEFKKNYL